MKKIEEMQRLRQKYPEFSPFVLLKISMITYGAVLTAKAVERIAKPDYAFGRASSFGLTYGKEQKACSVPGPVLLRDGLFVYINYGEDYPDPYTIDYDGETDRFYLYDKKTMVDEVDFVPPADLFSKKTRSGKAMSEIVDIRAQKLLFNARGMCDFWKTKEQCHFCALFSSDGNRTLHREDARDVVRAALDEPGRFSEIYITGGTDMEDSFRQEAKRYMELLQCVGEEFDGRFPGQLMAPAYEKSLLKNIYEETQITSYSADLEFAGEKMFRRFCPGKQHYVGYQTWVSRLIEAVEVFGRGNVYTQIVAGAELAKPDGYTTAAEALAENLKMCEYLAMRDVIFLSTVWRPHRASRLGMQPVPPVEYHVALADGIHRIRKAYHLQTMDDDYKHCGNHVDSDLERTDYGLFDFAKEQLIVCADLSVRPDGHVLIGLRREKTIHGSSLIYALWFDKTLRLVLTDGETALAVQGKVSHCRIVGKDFSASLMRVRGRDCTDDIAAVFELVLPPGQKPQSMNMEEVREKFPDYEKNAGWQRTSFDEIHLDQLRKRR